MFILKLKYLEIKSKEFTNGMHFKQTKNFENKRYM